MQVAYLPYQSIKLFSLQVLLEFFLYCLEFFSKLFRILCLFEALQDLAKLKALFLSRFLNLIHPTHSPPSPPVIC